MSRAVQLLWDDRMTGYDFGAWHPMKPVRLRLTIDLVRAFGLDAADGLTVLAPPVATDEQLRLVHTADYIAAVRRASEDPSCADVACGIGTDDTPAFKNMHEVSALIAGGSLAAADAVWTGAAPHAVNFAGGLHHAMPGAASGFCVYNDAALAVARLLELGAERVVYVDVDVHHGDGVQAVFWNDPRVMTISLHESPRFLFPGTGFPEETGGPDAEGTAVNVALPPGVSDSGWLRAFDAVVPPLVEAFAPDALVSQHGADTHIEDPLAHLGLTIDAQRAAAVALHDLAHRHCAGRWIATGGGGYAATDVVPRIWTHLVAEAAHLPIAPGTEVPFDWREQVRIMTGESGPQRMTDGGTGAFRAFSGGYDPSDRLDQAVLATRRAVFPAHGLDPLFDI
ncbi:acetoin utilization protein AcuC [Yinghuangia seranimata]|uniref:acetoin utilization protein AcuC n=1 Tax=Yinghuangia seranimata TaxID=408067 RepID=UPI00248CEC21|nr:acetoin utilization protein AcuC [Yinghuangia seranimata]MDI2132913.1 acetoin utilization protein AcuC [Yinghuangia seranimata]